jgi:hypothetical protein
MNYLPVLPDDGDGCAAQTDGHTIQAIGTDADEISETQDRGVVERGDAGTALRGGRGSDRGTDGGGGSKGLKLQW